MLPVLVRFDCCPTFGVVKYPDEANNGILTEGDQTLLEQEDGAVGLDREAD